VPLLDFEFHTKSPVACNVPLYIEHVKLPAIADLISFKYRTGICPRRQPEAAFRGRRDRF
jgi:hypothetical protein